MTQPSEHERYVAKINSLVEAGRDDLIDEVVAEQAGSAASGRDAFWRTTRPGGWFTRSLLDAGDAPSDSADGEDALVLRLSLDLADQWDRRDLLRD